jgi:DNA repair protein RadC
MKEALRYGAVNIILMHNHPSGNPTPSGADILMTERIKRASELLDINLLDHIIIGSKCYVSMKQEGLID